MQLILVPKTMIIYFFAAVSIKNCELPQILPHLEANKSASPTFMDTGKRHKTPRSEMKGSLLQH